MRLDLAASLSVEQRLCVFDQTVNTVRLHIARGATETEAVTVAPNEGELARVLVKSDRFELPTVVVVTE